MVLIWKGWGILAPAVGAAVALLGVSFAFVSPLMPGIIVILGGGGLFLLGYWLNVLRPPAEVGAAVAARRASLHRLVDAGQYAIPGAPLPRTFDEAHAMAEAQVGAEAPLIAKALTNRHTFFWIPMQWCGPLGSAVGVVWLVQALIS